MGNKAQQKQCLIDMLMTWINENPEAYDWICEEFCRRGATSSYISVRDIWASARSRFGTTIKACGSSYAFPNFLTPQLSRHLCARYKGYAEYVRQYKKINRFVGQAGV